MINDLQRSILNIAKSYSAFEKPNWLDGLSWVNKLSNINSLSNSFPKYDSIINRIDGLNNIGNINSAIQNSIQQQASMVAVLGMHDFASRYPKMLYSDIASKLQTDMSRQIGLSAIVGKLNTIPDFADITQNAQLRRILSMQDHFSSQFSGFASIAESRSVINQLFSASTTYNRVFASVAVNAASIDAEDTLDIVEEIANRVNEAAIGIYEKGYFTKEDLIRIKEEIFDYFRLVSKTDWVSFIGLVLTVFFGLLPYCIPPASSTSTQSSNVATKEDIQQFKDSVVAFYREEASQKGIAKRLAADVALRVKPYKKSYVIKTIKKGTTITVLNIEADWAYISYVNDVDGMPACGWISTRFFCKQVFSKSFKERVKNNRVNNSRG